VISYKLAASLGIVFFVCSLSVYAQSVGPELKHFAADGISFDYPTEYSVTDESTAQAQQLILTRKGSSVQFTIVARRGAILSKELPAAIENSTEPLIKQVTIKLTDGKKPPERTSIKTLVGPKEAEGVRLRSSGRRTSTGEVIWLQLGLRLISMALVRSDIDDSTGSQLWQTVCTSLRVEAPLIGAMKAEVEPTGKPITGAVLNGKALTLPKPAYPRMARAAHASGTVLVQVLIDEEGNVIAAKAVEGHPLLQAVCVAAAREAKFSPTLLEREPVKVTGVIMYNFVAR
jgi:TonB family protein